MNNKINFKSKVFIFKKNKIKNFNFLTKFYKNSKKLFNLFLLFYLFLVHQFAKIYTKIYSFLLKLFIFSILKIPVNNYFY